MNITEYAASRGHELEEVKKHITIHHRSKLSTGEIEMLDIALSKIINPVEAVVEEAVEAVEAVEEEVVEEVEGEMLESTQFKPEWCTDWQWKVFGTNVYKREEKLKKTNGFT